ncbi:MAG: universal stress protein [Acetobacterales bacterium]
MPIKSILVHLDRRPDHVNRIGVAIDLAKRFGAHLELFYPTQPVPMPAAIHGYGASHEFLEEEREIAEKHRTELAKGLDDRDDLKDISWRFAHEEGEALGPLAHHALYADLTIVTKSHPDSFESWLGPHLPQHLPLACGCPTLILPEGWDHTKPFGRTICFGWKPGSECARTMRDALPFFETANRVLVLAVRPNDPDHMPDEGVDRYLRRHGVRTQLLDHMDDDRHAGKGLVNAVRDFHCDMLVMGSYGRSRWRELILGGATEHVLEHADVPVLMGH